MHEIHEYLDEYFGSNGRLCDSFHAFQHHLETSIYH